MRHRTELQQLTIDGSHEVVAVRDLSPTWGGARPGAGRPRGDRRTRTISVRVSESLYNVMQSHAMACNQTIGAYLTALLEECELGDI